MSTADCTTTSSSRNIEMDERCESDELWMLYILQLYNALNNTFIIYNCSCYDAYRKNFAHEIFVKKRSYLCCVIVQNRKVEHCAFPIMLGTMIDFSIRTTIDRQDTSMFGSFIIDGNYKIIPNFLTNNLNSIHVYRHRDENVVRWSVVMAAGTTLQLRYNDKEGVSSALGGSRQNEFTEKLEPIDDWLSVLNSENIFRHKATTDEYLVYFQNVYNDYPNIDELANKTIITAPVTLNRMLKLFKSNGSLQAISESGNMFFALSKKDTVKLKKDYANVYLNIDGHKQGQITSFLGLTKRSINSQTKNSNALLFPSDGDHFICYLTCKEMRDAGETIFLAYYVLVSIEMSRSKVKNCMKKCVAQNIITVSTTTRNDGGDGGTPTVETDDDNEAKRSTYRIAVDGFLTNFRIRKEREHLLRLKRQLRFATFITFGGTYLNINTKGNVLVKYSNVYRCLISAFEYKHLFEGAFDQYSIFSRFSVFAQSLPSSIMKSQPAKSTVTVNNKRGACNMLDSELKVRSFLFSIGYNSAILYTRQSIKFANKVSGKYTRLTLLDQNIDAGTNVFNDDDDADDDTQIDNACCKPVILDTKMLADPDLTKYWLKYAEDKESGESPPSEVVRFFKEMDQVLRAQGRSKPSIDKFEFHQRCTCDIDPDYKRSNEYLITLLNVDLCNNHMFVLRKRSSVSGLVSTSKKKKQKKTFSVNGGPTGANDVRDDDVDKKTKEFFAIRSLTSDKLHRIITVDSYLRHLYYRAYDLKKMEKEVDEKTRSSTLKKIPNDEALFFVKTSEIEDANNFYINTLYRYFRSNKRRSNNQIILYAAFGDINGGTIEDGLILDKTFVENSPTKLISVTLNVKFLEYDKKNSTRYVKRATEEATLMNVQYQPINRIFDDCILFGVVLSRLQLAPFKSKNVDIVECALKSHYYYVLSLKKYQNVDAIESYFLPYASNKRTVNAGGGAKNDDKSRKAQDCVSVIIHYRYNVPLGVGTKLCNQHGQKGVVSMVRDLSRFVAWKRDGTKVHPQILYSMQSVIGRTVASQVFEMLHNDDMAVNEYGELVAPISLFVHSIESSVKARVSTIRNDLMTRENGFDANNCTSTALLLANQQKSNHTYSNERLHYLKELFKGAGANIHFN